MSKGMPVKFCPRFAAFSCAALFLTLVCADAAVITVTRLDDRNVGCNAGDCSLREALALADSQAGDDTIGFSVPTPSTITLQNGEIAINSNVTINGVAGLNALVIDGNNQRRIFAIGAGTTVAI